MYLQGEERLFLLKGKVWSPKMATTGELHTERKISVVEDFRLFFFFFVICVLVSNVTSSDVEKQHFSFRKISFEKQF